MKRVLPTALALLILLFVLTGGLKASEAPAPRIERHIIVHRFDVGGFTLVTPPDSTGQRVGMMLPPGSVLAVPEVVVDTVRTPKNFGKT